jgi:hypothetical protein
MSGDNTALYVVGGLGLLYLISKMSPTAVAAQQAALANAAALQSQNIAANANMTNVQTGANLISDLANDFSN